MQQSIVTYQFHYGSNSFSTNDNKSYPLLGTLSLVFIIVYDELYLVDWLIKTDFNKEDILIISFMCTTLFIFYLWIIKIFLAVLIILISMPHLTNEIKMYTGRKRF